MTKPSSNMQGILFLLLAHTILSVQGIVVKGFSSEYPVLEMAAFRSVIALPACLVIFRLEGHRGFPNTKHFRLNAIRGILLFFSYTTYFMGIASLPLADIAAIRNCAPLMLTFLSVVFLSEKVDSKRWIALLIGFSGVILVVQPGTPSFDLGSIFIIISTLLYAIMVLITRKLQETESSGSMAYYTTWMFIAATIVLTPITLLFGEQADMHPSIAFLFHNWHMPTLTDWLIMSSMGIIWGTGMYFITRSYSIAEVSAIAPIEYSPLLINLVWDGLLWQIYPTWIMLLGAMITIASGWYILNKDRKELNLKDKTIDILIEDELIAG